MKRKRSTIFALVVVALVGLILTACSESDTSTKADKQNINIKKLVQDYSTNKVQAKSASITSDQLIVTEKGGKEVTYDLPEDEFFVSIAPFVNSTHE